MTMFNDSIADMLTRTRNAQNGRKFSITMPHSRVNQAIAGILKENRFIADSKVSEGKKGFKVLELTLSEDPETITSLVRMSKPGRRIYAASKDIPTVVGGRGIVIISTSSGVMTGRDAKQKGLGGELICKVW